MGVSWPDRMADRLRVFRPYIAIFTSFGLAHLAEGQFPEQRAYFDEKARLTRSTRGGFATLNRDDTQRVQFRHGKLDARTLWFGRLP